MNTLDRYLLRQYAFVLIAVLLGISAIMAVILLFEELDSLLKHSPGMLLSLEYIILYLPNTISGIVPLIMLLSSFYFLHRLQAKNELVECFVAGFSPVRLMTPVLLFSVVVSGFFFYLQERVIPNCTEKAQDIMEVEIKGGQKMGRAATGNWLRGTQNRLYHVPLYDVDEAVLHGVWLVILDPNAMRVTETYRADKGTFKDGVWVFENCLHCVIEGDRIVVREEFPTKQMELEERPEDFAGVQLSPQEMGYTQLKELIDNLGLTGGILQRYHAEMAFKLAFPFSCVVLTMLGMAWSLRPQFSGVSMELLGTLLIGAAYMAFSALSLSLGGKGVIPAELSGWSSTLVFGVIGIAVVIRRQFYPFA